MTIWFGDEELLTVIKSAAGGAGGHLAGRMTV